MLILLCEEILVKLVHPLGKLFLHQLPYIFLKQALVNPLIFLFFNEAFDVVLHNFVEVFFEVGRNAGVQLLLQLLFLVLLSNKVKQLNVQGQRPHDELL